MFNKSNKIEFTKILYNINCQSSGNKKNLETRVV